MTYEELAAEWASPSSVLTAHTSGSTGTPRTILLPKEMVAESARRTIDFFSLTERSALHSSIAADFIGGKMMLIRSLICGGTFSYEPPTNRPMATVGADAAFDLVAAVPSQMRYIIDNLSDMPQVRNYLIGGSAIHPLLRREIADVGINAFESYGMTETSSHIALRRVTADPSLPFEVLPGVTLDADERGCLVIELGRFGRLTSNDLVEFTDDTRRRFVILGRADDVIVTGGKKVNPAEVEAVAATLLPGIEICVTSRPDPLWTSRIVLLAETSADDPAMTGLRDRLRPLLPTHALPKEIIAVDRLPRTASGKILRRPLDASE